MPATRAAIGTSECRSFPARYYFEEIGIAQFVHKVIDPPPATATEHSKRVQRLGTQFEFARFLQSHGQR